MILSRYSGPSSPEVSCGFSGDVEISWESLDFQPYFTLTASNIGYVWISHDIGGHRYGYRDDELQLRWLQFGVFSPINRLHSAKSEFLSKEPWNYQEPYRNLMIMLQLRHELIPYIYTMNILSNEEKIPFIRPLYYYYPDIEESSYEIKNQYFLETIS